MYPPSTIKSGYNHFSEHWAISTCVYTRSFETQDPLRKPYNEKIRKRYRGDGGALIAGAV